MSVFNVNNTGHKTGKYPLFLGEGLGVIDTINVTYPVFEELYQTQLSQIWNEFEVDLTQDRQDMINMPKSTVDMMVKTIMWQHTADSVACRSIVECLGECITNTEFANWAQIWNFFEVIHGRTYSHIIKQTFKDPLESLEELYENFQVMQRSKVLIDVFDGMKEALKTNDMQVIEPALVKCLVALFALEAISFMASFAITFGIGETGKFQGITQLVKLICRDEVLHSRGGFHTMKILKDDERLGKYLNSKEFVATQIAPIINEVINQEYQWSDYIFSDGQLVGLSSELVKEYVAYMSKPVCDLFGIAMDVQVTKNPLPYMEKYIDSSKVQAAAQEIQLTSYKVGAIIDDTDDLEFD